MKVLIVKASALGDVVHALPVLAWLKSADPAMEIDWLVEANIAPLLDGHPLLRKVHRLATRAWRSQGAVTALRESLRVIRQLRREAYDVALDLQGNGKSGLFTLLCGAPLRYGFDRHGVREWLGLPATNWKVSVAAVDQHISERSLAIARAAFPSGHERLLAGPLPVDPAAFARVDQQLADFGISGQIAVCHYGTTWPTKLWSVENWQSLVRRIATETTVTPVLTWGSDEELAVVREIAVSGDGRAVVWPRGSLPELVALLARADLAIGGDTGPIHMAAAVGTATVSLFRVTDGRRNGPRGDRHVRLQVPLDCAPCLRKECARDDECAAAIGVPQVLAAVAGVLARRPLGSDVSK